MTETQEIPAEKIALWRVGKWGNGSTPDGMAIIFCDAWETAIALDAIPERTARLIVEAHNETLLARDTAARKECAEIARGVAKGQADGWRKNPMKDGCGGENAASNTGYFIATAIEATIGGGNG